jgi:putative sterol carrier protein
MKIEITVSVAPRHLDVLEWVIDKAPSVEQALAYLGSQCGPYAALADQDWQTAVGVATGKINAQEAFISGKILFKGDHERVIATQPLSCV